MDGSARRSRIVNRSQDPDFESGKIHGIDDENLGIGDGGRPYGRLARLGHSPHSQLAHGDWGAARHGLAHASFWPAWSGHGSRGNVFGIDQSVADGSAACHG